MNRTSLSALYEALDDHLALRLHQARTSMTPEQRAIGGGSHIILPINNLVIFGYVMTTDDVTRSEVNAGASADEAHSAAYRVAYNLASGLLYGRWSSVDCPAGELGTNHASACWPITLSQYDAACAWGWDPGALVDAGEADWLISALTAYIAAKGTA